MTHRHVALYTRVSTKEQDTARQISELASWAERMGWQPVATVSETASGAALVRANRSELISIAKKPALAKQLITPSTTQHGKHYNDQLAKLPKIDAILVTELSRWSRSVIDLVTTAEDLANHNISLLCLNGLSIDMSSAQGRLMATIFGGLAEFERELISERVKSGMQHARRKGKHLGRKKGRTAIWSKYAEITELARAGMSQRGLAFKFNTSHATIRRMIAIDKANRPTTQ